MAKEILSERSGIINNADKVLNKGLRGTQLEIFKSIIATLIGFDTDGDSFEFTDDNIRKINELEQQIRRIVTNSKYQNNVSSYLRDFDKIKDVNIRLQKSINGINASKIKLSTVQRMSRNQVINELLGQGLDTNFVTPVRDIIYDSVVSGSSIKDAEKTLRTFIRGDKTRLGTLERYVSQVSRDSISQYDGLIQGRIAEEFNLNAFAYTGSLIQDSRAQCIRWVSKGILKTSELEREIQWAFNNGTGMIPGTIPANFSSLRGGYNCRHETIAIRLTPENEELFKPRPEPILKNTP